MSTSQSPYTGRVQLFLDGADPNQILEWAKNPRIAGFTTNPSLMKKAGVTDYPGFCKKLLQTIVRHPISFEVFADDVEEMGVQARIIREWGPNVFVKIPVINTKGASTLKLVEALSREGTQLNITAILTPSQVNEVCSVLVGPKSSVVSVFAGRIADSGRDPMPIMENALRACRAAGPNVKLLWASTREVWNVVQADQMGCDIITVPSDILKKLDGLGRDLFEISMDTVQAFKKDSDASGFRL